MPEPSRVLTLATLKRKGACADQRALFRAKFGAAVVVTEALCVEHAAAFSWSWGAENLLSAPAEAARASAEAAYQAARAPAFARAYINDTI